MNPVANLNINTLLDSSPEYFRTFVLQMTDYTGLHTMPRSFVLLNKLGNPKVITDPKIYMEQRTGVQRMHSPSVALTIPARDAVGAIDFDLYLSNGVADIIRPGVAFEIAGYETNDSAPAAATIIIQNQISGNTYNVRTVSVTRAAAAVTASTFTASMFTMYLTSLEPWKDAAPSGFSIATDYIENWVQFYRFTYEADPMTDDANKVYQGLKMNTAKEAESILYGSLEYSLLCSHETMSPNKSSTSLGGTTRGLPFYGGKMGGLPMLLGTNDLSDSNVKSHTVVSNYSTVDTVAANAATCTAIINGFRDFAMEFNDSGRLLGFCSGEMIRLVEVASAAAYGANVNQVPKYIEFPRFNIYGVELQLGRRSIDLVEVGALDSGMQHRVYDGTYYANRNWFIYCIDPTLFSMCYHNHSVYGMGLPNSFMIEQVRNAGNFENEWRAMMTCGMLDPHKHGVFMVNYTAQN